MKIKVFLGVLALVLFASIGNLIYESKVPSFAVGQCITSNSDNEAWEVGFIQRIDQVGKKKYKTTAYTTNLNQVVIFESDLDFYIQSYYYEVPCPSELLQ